MAGMSDNDPLAPEPGEREPAPEPLALVQSFVNTNDIEAEQDELGNADALRAWLESRDLLPVGSRVGAADLERALAVREGLRALATANAGGSAEPSEIERLNRSAVTLPLLTEFSPRSEWELVPGEAGVPGALGHILSVAVRAMADGTWARMKACLNDECRWLFYDHSRNHSGTWCTMAVCGNRMKARTYRQRHRPGSQDG